MRHPTFSLRSAVLEPDERVIAVLTIMAVMAATLGFLLYGPVARLVRMQPRSLTVTMVLPAPALPLPPPVPAPPVAASQPAPVFAPPILDVADAPQAWRRAPARSNVTRVLAVVQAEPVVARASPAPMRDASLDARYAAQLRDIIERNKSNPTSAAYRMMHPHGTAVIAFVVARDGVAGAPRLVGSSGADMLDEQALRIVARCRFPAMPPGSFAGAAAHEFQVEVIFPPFQSAD